MTLPTLDSVFNSSQIDVLQQWIESRIDVAFQTGQATLVDGVITVSNTSITADTVIVLSSKFANTGNLYYTLDAGVGFTITSTENTDAGDVTYLIRHL